VRAAFSKYGGALGESNSVAFMFQRVGVVTYPKSAGTDDTMLEAAIDVGAEECVSADDRHEFITTAEGFAAVRDALEAKFGAPQAASITWRAQTPVPVKDDAGEALVKLIEVLDDHDDVQHVYGNYELSHSLMEKLAS